MRKHEDMTIAGDIIEVCRATVDRAVAVKAVRELCRYFGGQLVYIPVRKISGDTTKELLGVLRDAAGEADADRILAKLMVLYGGHQIYIPMERTAFRNLIACEVFERYDGNTATIGDICREYGFSFNTLYTLYYEGREIKLQKEFQFEEN
jgi:Mor family transcriptional regulator